MSRLLAQRLSTAYERAAFPLQAILFSAVVILSHMAAATNHLHRMPIMRVDPGRKNMMTWKTAAMAVPTNLSFQRRDACRADDQQRRSRYSSQHGGSFSGRQTSRRLVYIM